MTSTTILNTIEALANEADVLKVQIAHEGHHAEENGKTISAIASEYNVSRRSVNRYMEKYEDLVVDVDNAIAEAEAATEETANQMAAVAKKVPANASETYAKIVELEVKSNKGRVRTRPAKNSVAIYEAVSGAKDDFFAKMYEEGKSKSFTEREFRRSKMYMDAIED